jgi:hypothetical protein
VRFSPVVSSFLLNRRAGNRHLNHRVEIWVERTAAAMSCADGLGGSLKMELDRLSNIDDELSVL